MAVESEHIVIDPVKQAEKHKRLVKEIVDRKKFSLRKMQDYHQRWDEQDETVRAYLPESETSVKGKHNKRFKREFDYISLELPYSFAIVMTAHTYWASVFLSRSPVYQFSGRHGEPQNKVMAVEAIMDYQLSVGMHLPVLYNWLYDFAKYGMGIVGNYWDREEVTVCSYRDEPVTLFGVPIAGKTKKQKFTETLVGYEGNRLYNIRPHDFFPDPRVSIWDFQSGEFCGRDTTASYLSLQQQGYFNIKEAQRASTGKRGGGVDQEGTAQMERAVQPDEEQGPGVGTARVLEMVVRIVPKTWELGDSTKVEKWVFTVANENTLIGCRPLGAYHDKFPFAVIEYGLGSSEFVKLSMIDIIKPLTDTLSWLFNVHFFNVRKALNDVRVVDPSRVSMADVLRPGAGGVIKLKPEAYGTDARTAVHQLQVTDVTRTHLADTQFVESMTQRVTGVVDNIMGMVNNSGRKTATEVRTSTGFSTNRLKTPAEYASATGWAPLAQMMLQNTQQLYDDEKKFRIAGNLMLEGTGKLPVVTPETLTGFYDFVPVDGSMPVDRIAQATMWKDLLVQLAAVPQIAMQWDIGGMLAHTMKLAGERNIDRFRIQLTPDQQMAAQAQAGNVIPLGGEGVKRSGGTPPLSSGGVQ